jgi:DNA-binding transcriptional regulator YhcF (GntR family)
MFVSKRRQIYSSEERTRRIDQAVTSLVSQAFRLGFSAEEIVEEVTKKTREHASSSDGSTNGSGGSE